MSLHTIHRFIISWIIAKPPQLAHTYELRDYLLGHEADEISEELSYSLKYIPNVMGLKKASGMDFLLFFLSLGLRDHADLICSLQIKFPCIQAHE